LPRFRRLELLHRAGFRDRRRRRLLKLSQRIVGSVIARLQDRAENRGEEAMEKKARVTVITGAADGIGKAFAKTFFDGGDTVVAIDINEARLNAMAEEFATGAGLVVPMMADVSDSE